MGEGRGHPDVDDGDIRAMVGDGVGEARCVGQGGADVYARLGQQPGQTLAQQRRVVGDHDPHGSSASTIVPCGWFSVTRRHPRSAETRSARPCSPVPCGLAWPTPPSATATRTTDRSHVTVIDTSWTSACLTALVVASAMTNQAAPSMLAGKR